MHARALSKDSLHLHLHLHLHTSCRHTLSAHIDVCLIAAANIQPVHIDDCLGLVAVEGALGGVQLPQVGANGS